MKGPGSEGDEDLTSSEAFLCHCCQDAGTAGPLLGSFNLVSV